MGGKQSTSATGTSSSSSSPVNTIPTSNVIAAHRHHRSNVVGAATNTVTGAPAGSHHHHHRSSLNPNQLVGGNDSRQRARSLSHVPILSSSSSGTGPRVIGIEIPNLTVSNGIFAGDSDGSSSSAATPDETTPGHSLESALFGGRVYAAHSLPTQLSSTFNGIKCPVCCKFVIPDDLEYHLVMCLTKPRISYNEDVLAEDKEEECVICLDDLQQGDTIARLPCLCIYHKCCIDSWFEVNRSCPEHPSD